MKVTIDNITVEAEEGSTILECARRAGIDIPTLCHRDGIEHYSSCMVCLVKNKKNNGFIPSCSALAEDGMNID
ncbi:MAG: (2Fe-2S)-binding protein, partial [Bacteroidales bacterium]|nr:(2Fe-2S)-binding protein [Bacteroidales bacterium]